MRTRGQSLPSLGMVLTAWLAVLAGYGCAPTPSVEPDTRPEEPGAASSERAGATIPQRTRVITGRLLSPQKKPIIPVHAQDVKLLIDPRAVVMILTGPATLEYPPVPATPARLVAEKGKITP